MALGYPKNKVGHGDVGSWLLLPSAIPQRELKQQRQVAQLRKAKGIAIPASFPATPTT